jgi:hypothetical protein
MLAFRSRSPPHSVGANGAARGGGAIAIACSVDCQIAGFLAANGDAGSAGGSIVVNATAKLSIDTSLALFEALGGAGRDETAPAGGGGGKVVFLVPPALITSADSYIIASLPVVRVAGGRATGNSTLHGGAGAFLVATPTITQSSLYIHGQSALVRGSTPLPLLPAESASTVASFGTVSLENVKIVGAIDGLANVNVRKAVLLGTRDQLDLVVSGNLTLTEDASLLAERLVVRAERLLLQKQATLVALRVARRAAGARQHVDSGAPTARWRQCGVWRHRPRWHDAQRAASAARRRVSGARWWSWRVFARRQRVDSPMCPAAPVAAR